MTLKCDELSVHKLFKSYSQLKIPKYQRGYTWNKKQVSEFMDDLQNCFEGDSDDKSLHHFFGGIVAIVSKDIETNSEYLEIIDGQQRLTTFVLFVAQIVNNITKYIEKFKSEMTNEQINRLRKFSNGLRYNYLFFKEEFKITNEDALKLSPTASDVHCFRDIIEGVVVKKNQYKRSSNKNIVESYNTLDNFVSGKIVNFKKPATVLKHLDRILEVLEQQSRLIFITTPDRNYAYQYFQVLNDRGMRLSAGNLLKADTLRLLEERGFHELTNETAELWDEILFDKPEETDKNLNTVYAARTGKRPNKNELPRQFMDDVLTIDRLKVNSKFGPRLRTKVNSVVEDVATVKRLRKATWVPENCTIVPWQRERLNSLVILLKNQIVIPLLLALTNCHSTQFYDMVTILERYICRYINIQKLNASSLEGVFLDFAPKFYDRKFPKKLFLNELKKILDKETSETQFRADLSELKFQRGKPREYLIKVFFSILENHWNSTGESLEPDYEMLGQTSDLKDLSIEHIYPCHFSKLWHDEGLDGVVHSLGNLTVLRGKEKIVADDKPFQEKREMFRRSSFRVNREVSKTNDWTFEELEVRQSALIDKAVNILIPIKKTNNG